MQIDDQLIAYLQQLSRLELPPEQQQETKAQLSDILAHMGQLDELDTDGLEELSHPFPFAGQLRTDEVQASANRDLILQNAPQQKDGCFQVPKTVE